MSPLQEPNPKVLLIVGALLGAGLSGLLGCSANSSSGGSAGAGGVATTGSAGMPSASGGGPLNSGGSHSGSVGGSAGSPQASGASGGDASGGASNTMTDAGAMQTGPDAGNPVGCPNTAPTGADSCTRDQHNLQCTYPNQTCVCAHDGHWNCFQGQPQTDCPANQPTIGSACQPIFGGCAYTTTACFCFRDMWNCIGVDGG
ncbi:MAG TPA: hypothetical protein VL137_09340 [Polyangiaceae bacterium]|nr:hypothetical protein [Polyangiaceae bacterium]